MQQIRRQYPTILHKRKMSPPPPPLYNGIRVETKRAPEHAIYNHHWNGGMGGLNFLGPGGGFPKEKDGGWEGDRYTNSPYMVLLRMPAIRQTLKWPP